MKILIVDDDVSSGSAVAEFIEEQLAYQIHLCHNAEEAYNKLKSEEFNMVISDMRMPGISGLDLLKKIKLLPNGDKIEVVIMTGFGDMETSIEALRGGAYDYLLKPVNIEELAILIERVAEKIQLKEENQDLKENFEQTVSNAKIEKASRIQYYETTIREITSVGKIGVFSDVMRGVVRMAEQFHEDRSVPVLIEGETGTGKEVVARLVHFGKDSDITQPFISINCSAISPTLFESELFGYDDGAFTGARKEGKPGKLELAQGGTLFLDEIGEMPLDMQPKLLRVLQQREMYRVGGSKPIELDVRVIFATNRNLKQMVAEKTFRSDLYYRLNTGRLYIPPLRERREAILSFSQIFLDQYSTKRDRKFRFISKEAKAMLQEYNWPGNIRELKNSIERATLLFNDLELKTEHLRFLQSDESDFERKEMPIVPGRIVLPDDELRIEQLELEIVRKALKKFDNNKSKTAEYLGITRSALRSRMNKL
ncbi:sigma-54 dependent transcriptional regulator [Labilibaculum sp. DW002]|uniref:Sigma-54 dependent transcriptional regulator n=1 Tax=Paralabilibaculum antarcticum TaxID=2912572 RepID=A0ABT5VYF0_9BACT|nr:MULTISPECIES: sigma-54 dependent transcriptional regulator [unclassified Labilibaculum]MBI9059174.1 sigma-54-dependent Fis family transcriptional regulator [Labilibaculum sp.]MDE5419548.1 sigma-54 dependent transcriptional regulator [Labilibaculum sp. DW002]